MRQISFSKKFPIYLHLTLIGNIVNSIFTQLILRNYLEFRLNSREFTLSFT